MKNKLYIYILIIELLIIGIYYFPTKEKFASEHANSDSEERRKIMLKISTIKGLLSNCENECIYFKDVKQLFDYGEKLNILPKGLLEEFKYKDKKISNINTKKDYTYVFKLNKKPEINKYFNKVDKESFISYYTEIKDNNLNYYIYIMNKEGSVLVNYGGDPIIHTNKSY